jgi:hypothetical protein
MTYDSYSITSTSAESYLWFIDINHNYYQYIYWLVVSAYPSEKYEFVSWDDEIPNIWKNKKCLKPPISYQYTYGLFDINLPPR